jgi:hypothetical protein
MKKVGPPRQHISRKVANDYSNAVALWMQLHKKVFIRNLMEGLLA